MACESLNGSLSPGDFSFDLVEKEMGRVGVLLGASSFEKTGGLNYTSDKA
jgi:hypothetical protein